MNRIILELNKDYDPKDVSDVLNSIFSEKSSFAVYKVQNYKKLCGDFEIKYRMDSDQFLRRFENGELGDEMVYFDWYAAKKGLDLWMRKMNILKGVSIK